MDRITERKRICLEGYIRLRAELEEIDIKIADLSSLKSPRLDGVPHGTYISGDLSVMAWLIEEYEARRTRIKGRLKEIEKAVHGITDPDERAVIYLRYIENIPLMKIHEMWQKENTHIQYHKIYRLYCKGLQNIEIPLEMQNEI